MAGAEESAKAAQQLAEAARLHKGQIVVVGCSTSEVVGKRVGSWSTPEVGQAIFNGLHSLLRPWASTSPPSAASI